MRKSLKKSIEQVVQHRCKILPNSGSGASSKTCSKNVWKIFSKSEPRGPQRSPKSHQNPPQDPLGGLLGLSWELQMRPGKLQGSPREPQGGLGRPKAVKIDEKWSQKVQNYRHFGSAPKEAWEASGKAKGVPGRPREAPSCQNRGK